MQPPAWWALQAMNSSTLLACFALAFISSARVGRHTPYGCFLFVVALGFWSLLAGNTAYVAMIATGVWYGPPGWNDLFLITGWALIVVAFLLLLFRFPDHRVPRDPLQTGALLLAGGLALGALPLLRHGAAILTDPDVFVRTIYLFLDGLVVAVFVLSLGVLRRLRHATLGRLYLLLALALLVKTVGDLLFFIWPIDNPLGLIATATYPLAGLIAVVALARHHHAVASLQTRRVLADPAFVADQLILRDAARRLRGIAGALGERVVLRPSERSLHAEGIKTEQVDGMILAAASGDAWRRAVAAGEARAIAVLGAPAIEVFQAVRAAYEGPPTLHGGGP